MKASRVRALAAGVVLALLPSGVPASGQVACPSGQSLRGHLGVEIECDCTVSRSPTAERPWTFRSPIRVAAVERGGAAAGVLREGDLVLAVDGAPVTTPVGARRLAGLRPGERAVLRVRRGGRTLALPLTTGGVCSGDPRAIGATAPRALPRAPAAPSRPSSAAPRAAPAGVRQGGRAVPVPTPPDLQPAGWMGFGLACSGCGWAREADDPAPYWESSAPPRIHAVAAGSPAERAGMRAGDVLTDVDGYPVASRQGGRALGAVRPGQRVRLRIRRGGGSREIALVAARRPTGGEARLQYVGRVGDVGVEVFGRDAAAVEVGRQGDQVTVTVGGTRIRLTRAPLDGTP